MKEATRSRARAVVWFALPAGFMFHFVAAQGKQGNVGMEVLVGNEVRHSPSGRYIL